MTWKPPKAIQADMFGGDGTERFSARVASFKPKPVVKHQPVQVRQKTYGAASRVPVADAEVEHVKRTQRVKALMAGGKTYREALAIVFPSEFQEG